MHACLPCCRDRDCASRARAVHFAPSTSAGGYPDGALEGRFPPVGEAGPGGRERAPGRGQAGPSMEQVGLPMGGGRGVRTAFASNPPLPDTATVTTTTTATTTSTTATTTTATTPPPLTSLSCTITSATRTRELQIRGRQRLGQNPKIECRTARASRPLGIISGGSATSAPPRTCRGSWRSS